jgi:hypothetical protein
MTLRRLLIHRKDALAKPVQNLKRPPLDHCASGVDSFQPRVKLAPGEWHIATSTRWANQSYFKSCDVRFGSKGDSCAARRRVRFTPKSGHVQYNYSGLMQRSKKGLLFDHVIGASGHRVRHGETERLGSD